MGDDAERAVAERAVNQVLDLIVQDTLKKRIQRIDGQVDTSLLQNSLSPVEQKAFNEMYEEHISSLKSDMFEKLFDKISDRALNLVIKKIMKQNIK